MPETSVDRLLTIPASQDGDRIGLFGGSFNPAHQGHVHVTRCALQQLALDAVWWLVSPQNPLKSAEDMAPFEDRLRGARSLVSDEVRVAITGLEQAYGTRRTIDTLRRILDESPGRRFVWMMGADNLAQVSQWAAWRDIFDTVPIAVFARPGYAADALASPAAEAYADARVSPDALGSLADCAPPAWAWVEIPPHPASATAIRQRKNQ